MFNLLPNSTNRKLFKKQLCNQGSHYDDPLQKKPLCAKLPNQNFLLSTAKDEWNTKASP